MDVSGRYWILVPIAVGRVSGTYQLDTYIRIFYHIMSHKASLGSLAYVLKRQ